MSEYVKWDVERNWGQGNACVGGQVLVGGLGGPGAVVGLGLGGQLKWVSRVGTGTYSSSIVSRHVACFFPSCQEFFGKTENVHHPLGEKVEGDRAMPY